MMKVGVIGCGNIADIYFKNSKKYFNNFDMALILPILPNMMFMSMSLRAQRQKTVHLRVWQWQHQSFQPLPELPFVETWQ